MQVRCRAVDVDAIPGKQFAEVAAVDYTHCIKPVDTWDGPFRLYFGKPAEGDDEVVVTVFGGESLACGFHVANCVSELISERA